MSTEIRLPEMFKRPSAFLPIVMSLCAVAVIVIHLLRFGPAPQADEGSAAHIWQLLMAAQLPLAALFLIRWAPRAPRAALPVIAMQIGAALAALAPIYFLHW